MIGRHHGLVVLLSPTVLLASGCAPTFYDLMIRDTAGGVAANRKAEIAAQNIPEAEDYPEVTLVFPGSLPQGLDLNGDRTELTIEESRFALVAKLMSKYPNEFGSPFDMADLSAHYRTLKRAALALGANTVIIGNRITQTIAGQMPGTYVNGVMMPGAYVPVRIPDHTVHAFAVIDRKRATPRR